MTRTTCLRCDWEGETTASTCPNCGARPLYVLTPSTSTERTSEPASPEVPAPERTGVTVPATADPVEASGRSRRPAIGLVAALVVAVLVGIWLRGGEEPSAAALPSGVPSTSSTVAPSPPGSPSPSVSRSPLSPSPPILGLPEGPLSLGRHSVIAEGVPFSLRVPSGGWENHGDHYISKSTVGPQDAEAVILWTDVSRGAHAHACGQWWGAPDGSLADWADSASNVRGTDLVSGPTDVNLGGLAAQYVEFTVRRDVACQPGFFFKWADESGGAFWSHVEVGDTIRLWLVDVDGQVLVFEGDTHEHAGRALDREIQQIIASIQMPPLGS